MYLFVDVECLTAPKVALRLHATRVGGDWRVRVPTFEVH
jgi:hypothetical protein